MLLEDHLLEVPEPLLLVVRLHLILDVKSDRASEQGESDQEQVSVASHASAATKRRGDSCVCDAVKKIGRRRRVRTTSIEDRNAK